jgi:hypothetical protein
VYPNESAKMKKVKELGTRFHLMEESIRKSASAATNADFKG